MSKATMATVKSFVRKNQGKLLISKESDFDGMVDCVTQCEDRSFRLATQSPLDAQPRTLGIQGAWFVGGSRDYIQPFEENGLQGFEISNCCGCFKIAVQVS